MAHKRMCIYICIEIYICIHLHIHAKCISQKCSKQILINIAKWLRPMQIIFHLAFCFPRVASKTLREVLWALAEAHKGLQTKGIRLLGCTRLMNLGDKVVEQFLSPRSTSNPILSGLQFLLSHCHALGWDIEFTTKGGPEDFPTSAPAGSTDSADLSKKGWICTMKIDTYIIWYISHEYIFTNI